MRHIIRQIVNEIWNKYIYDNPDAVNNDYWDWYLSWVKEALFYIAEEYSLSESDIKRLFNKIL